MTARDLFREGDWLGDYEIRSRLRAGGMATLFLAQRHGAAGVSRPVVIKVIHPHLAENEQIVRMFIDEARISSHIRHSNVVYVEEFGEHDGVYYIVMEYVDGCSLQQLLHACVAGGRKLSPAIAVHIAIEVAAGLHAAHETRGEDGEPLGIVHRDVSPSNVLLTRDGRVKVIDFGIAKARGRLGATRSGSGLKGKLRYMSPDQAWGRPIDRRADIYALGICLWELLAGRRLFRAKNDLAVLELVRNPVIPPPSQLNPEVSAALDAVVLRAIALRPDDRHQTALELRRDLMAAVPDAVAIPPELVGELVHHVRAPDNADTADDSATFADLTESPSPLPGSSFPSGGELQPQPWRTRGLIAFGLVAACAIGIVIATARHLGDAAPTPAAAAAQAPGPDAGLAATIASDAAIAARPPIDASAAPAAEPGTPPAPVAMPAVPPPAPVPPPPRRAHPAPADKAHATSIEADGAVLADEPPPAIDKPATRPRPRPAKTVHADDAVLAQ
jgi:eukaryotic-like serine/threonine-protein kinase